jgi:uncharacterized damage-inducible protein DinB
MEITNMTTFLAYFEKTRQATVRIIQSIPPDQMDWSYLPGKFTFGDLIRHIAAIERNVFAEVAMGKQPTYQGCGKELADGYELTLVYFEQMHLESVEIFKTLSDHNLKQKVKSLDGTDVELGNFLRALIVHEIHHRAAMCIYLNLLGVQSPPVLGLTEEQVKLISRKK